MVQLQYFPGNTGKCYLLINRKGDVNMQIGDFGIIKKWKVDVKILSAKFNFNLTSDIHVWYNHIFNFWQPYLLDKRLMC